MTKKEHPEELDKSSAVHDEHADTSALALLSSEVKYDAGKLRDLIHNPYVFGAALLASFGGFSFGYDQGVISIILVMSQFRQQFPETSPDHAHYGFNVGLMTGMLELGAFIGCLFFPAVADWISRKWGLTVATFFFVIGATIQTAAQNYATIVAGRFIGGIGVGTLAMGAPLYISEISPPAWRGSFLVLEAISIVIGAIISYWITYGTRSIPSDWAFRLPFLLQIFPALVVGIGIHLFPFSPRWLAMRGRDQDSLSCLAKLRKRSPQEEKVQLEWKGILSEVRFQQALLERDYPDHACHPLLVGFKQWVDLFRPRYLRRTLVALAIPFFQQFSGVNAFVYYAPTFFEALGQSDNNSLILSGMVNVCQFVGGVPMMLYLDKVGRRKLAIYGGIAMAIPHLVMAGLMNRFSSDWASYQAVGWFCVALIYLYVLSYSVSYGPLAWVLPAEVFPSSKRAKGVGAATGMIWLANFIIGVVVPEMLLKLGWETYLFFGIFCVAAAVFSFFLVPETSNKSLEQVAAAFGDELIDEERNLQSRIAGEVWHGYGSHAEKEARV
ncbi:sugar transporter [Aspergillus costaricaensis CBS 115574]|uniref:Sugar transporter n=1 Tax=Aspergillus costaricaensis CBS 115574 TaxID=1448317 RepID=A0ACD1I7Z8_9EURO|nr:sugar transporter [Aspergillus costaricaensis CBS 115574]RAK86349.1 sugar transporter [Aspergillus costaricaensis CBS 115574]